MNEALQDAYNAFVEGGYNGTIQEYKELIENDINALNDTYSVFKDGGYNGSIKDLTTLLELGKPISPVEETADAGQKEVAVDTGSDLEDILSESKKANPYSLIQQNRATAGPADPTNQDLKARGNKFSNLYNALKAEDKIDEQIESLYSATYEDINNLAETIYTLGKENREGKYDKKEEDYFGMGLAPFLNTPLRFANYWEMTKAMGLNFIKDVAGPDAADFLVGEMGGSIAWIDPETLGKVTFKNDPERWKELAELNRRNDVTIDAVYDDTDMMVGYAAEKKLFDSFKEIQQNQSLMMKEGKLIEDDEFKLTSGAELFGGAISTIVGLAETVGPAAITKGATIIPQIVGPMWVDYNTTLANEKYPNSADPIGDLIENNEIENAVPVGLGTLAAGLEFMGFKGVVGAMTGKAGRYAPIINYLAASKKEGATELVQLGMETVNQSFAEGKNSAQAVSSAIEEMASPRGLEVTLRGMFGSGVIAGPGTLSQMLRSDEKSLETVKKHINSIAILQRERALVKNKEFRKVIDGQIEQVENSLKNFLTDTYIRSTLLSKEQRNELLSLSKQKEANSQSIAKLQNDFNNGKLTSRAFGQAKAVIVNNNKTISKKMVDIKNSIDENIVARKIKQREKMGAKAQQSIGLEDLSIKSYDSQKELENDLKEKGKKNAKQSASQFGVIYQSNKGQDILVNNELGIRKKKYTTLDHEILHAIMYKTVKQNPDAQMELGMSLYGELQKIFGDEIKNTELSTRLNRYLERAKGDPTLVANAWEEALNLFVEALGDRSIALKKKETIADKLRGFYRRIIGKTVKEFRLDTGEDVLNLLLDYNKSFEKGKWGERFKKLATEGAKGKLISGGPITQQEKDAVENVKMSAAEDKAAEVNKIYEEQGEAGAIEIIDQYEGMTRKLAKIYQNRPGYNEVDLMDAFKYEPGGLYDLISKYNPDKGITIANFINSLYKKRIIPIAEKIVGTEFTEDITQLRGVAAAETAEEAVQVSERKTKEEGKKGRLLKDAMDNNAYKAKLIERLEKNIAVNIKKLGEEISYNVTQTPFVRAIKDGLENDLGEITSRLIKKYGAEQFLKDYRRDLLRNYTTQYLSKHPLLKKGILKSVGGRMEVKLDDRGIPFESKFIPKWVEPTKTKKGYEWVDKDGNQLKIDRDNTGYQGKTSGHIIYKRNPDIVKIITEQEFVDYHFRDGKKRKVLKPNAIKALGKVVSAEMGFEIMQEDFKNKGKLYQKFEERAQVLGEELQVNANLQIALDIERGNIKQSADFSFSENLQNDIERGNIPDGTGLISNDMARKAFNAATKTGVNSKEYKNYISTFDVAPDIVAKFSETIEENPFYQDLRTKKIKLQDKYYKDLDLAINDIIEKKFDVKRGEEISEAAGKFKGAKIKYYLRSPRADDFMGLLDRLLTKGKLGTAQRKFFEDTLMIPYFKGEALLDTARVALKSVYKDFLKENKDIAKVLKKKINSDSWMTYDHAVRVYLWKQAGYEIPGISKKEIAEAMEAILKDRRFRDFANKLRKTTNREKGWIQPDNTWPAASLLSDMYDLTRGINRQAFLADFIENADIIFSNKNLNKLRSVLGNTWVESMENMLRTMKSGNNFTDIDYITSKYMGWVRGSIGTIMFLNTRSAMLQLLSTGNYINWSDNNFVKAAAAFANQPQYWKDFVKIFMSPKLKERRGGLKTDVLEAELAQVAQNTKSLRGVAAWIIKQGFKPTQFADSLAIAAGGATFYRNRINTYLKQGMTLKEAEKEAWADFSYQTELAQQSANAALLSTEQKSLMGRLILNFANTPQQYYRLSKRAAGDLLNGRGSAIENLSKIAYYTTLQNLIFSYLQAAGFWLIGFEDDEDMTEEEKRKEERTVGYILNGMSDTILRGAGLNGAIVSGIKNTIIAFNKELKKPPTYADPELRALQAIANISPSVGSKVTKGISAYKTYEYEKDVIDEMGLFGTNVDGKFMLSPGYSVVGKFASALVNTPTDRMYDKTLSISEILDYRNSLLQKTLLLMGYKSWQIDVPQEEFEKIREEAKAKRKIESPKKAAKTRKENQAKKRKSRQEGLAKLNLNQLGEFKVLEAKNKKQGKEYTVEDYIKEKNIK